MNPESSVAPTQAPQIQTPSEINAEKRYTLPGSKRFLPDNPGRPKGVKNKSTVIRELLISSANRDTARIFRQHLRRPASKGEFTKAMDQLICLLGPAKPLIEIDNSKHTHMTVVLDATPEQQPPANPT